MNTINQSSANLTFIERLSQQRQEQSEKLASAKKINRAADDAAGLQIASRLSSNIAQNQQLNFNAQDQININSSQSSALSIINTSLQRANELSIQSGNPLADSNIIQQELDGISEQVNAIADEVLGQNNFLSGLDASDPAATQTILESASTLINQNNASLGASSNALSSQVVSYEAAIINTSASRSRIEDTDFAKQTSEQQKTEALLQSAILTKQNEEERKGLLFNQLV